MNQFVEDCGRSSRFLVTGIEIRLFCSIPAMYLL